MNKLSSKSPSSKRLTYDFIYIYIYRVFLLPELADDVTEQSDSAVSSVDNDGEEDDLKTQIQMLGKLTDKYKRELEELELTSWKEQLTIEEKQVKTS